MDDSLIRARNHRKCRTLPSLRARSPLYPPNFGYQAVRLPNVRYLETGAVHTTEPAACHCQVRTPASRCAAPSPIPSFFANPKCLKSATWVSLPPARGRPSCFPFARALRKPALTRSWIRDLSNSATVLRFCQTELCRRLGRRLCCPSRHSGRAPQALPHSPLGSRNLPILREEK